MKKFWHPLFSKNAPAEERQGSLSGAVRALCVDISEITYSKEWFCTLYTHKVYESKQLTKSLKHYSALTLMRCDPMTMRIKRESPRAPVRVPIFSPQAEQGPRSSQHEPPARETLPLFNTLRGKAVPCVRAALIHRPEPWACAAGAVPKPAGGRDICVGLPVLFYGAEKLCKAAWCREAERKKSTHRIYSEETPPRATKKWDGLPDTWHLNPLF